MPVYKSDTILRPYRTAISIIISQATGSEIRRDDDFSCGCDIAIVSGSLGVAEAFAVADDVAVPARKNTIDRQKSGTTAESRALRFPTATKPSASNSPKINKPEVL